MGLRMFGKLGWKGQCRCLDCGNGNRCKRSIKAEETKQWIKDYDDEFVEDVGEARSGALGKTLQKGSKEEGTPGA